MELSVSSPQTLETISSPIGCSPVYCLDKYSLSSMTHLSEILETDSSEKDSTVYQQTLENELCRNRIAESKPGSPSEIFNFENTGDDDRIGLSPRGIASSYVSVNQGHEQPSFSSLDVYDGNLVADDDQLRLPDMISNNNSREDGLYSPYPWRRPSATTNVDDIKPLSSRCIYADLEPSTVGAGLGNLGNTCFLNAILQCITHTVSLLQSLLSLDHVKPHDCPNEDFCALCALRQHIDASVEYSGNTISPSGIVNNLRYISEDFVRYSQEDAHEFLQRFLERLADSSPIPKRILNNSNLSQDNNLVNHIFGGRLISNLRCCNCGHSSNTYESLIDLSLEIEDRDDLVSALESFTKVEMLEDPDSKFTCENCKELVSGEKQLKLDSVPSVAAFHFKRFKNNGVFVEKIDKHVDFPLELDLQPYTCCILDDHSGLKYELYAVVVHDGYFSSSGHYFCFIRSSPDIWHKFDDSKVYRVDESMVLSQGAYILFYARQGTPWFSSFIEANKACFELNMTNTSPKLTSPTSVLENVHDIGDIPTHVVNDATGGLASAPEKMSPVRESYDQINRLVVNDAAVRLASASEKMSPVRESCDQINKYPEKSRTIPSIDLYFNNSPEIVLPRPCHDSRKRKKSGTSEKTKESRISDSKRIEACKYVKKTMQNSRSAQLLAALRGSPDKTRRRNLF